MGDLIDFTLSNARRFYSSKGQNLAAKGLKRYLCILTGIFLTYWSKITNFKILRELGRGENYVNDSLV